MAFDTAIPIAVNTSIAFALRKRKKWKQQYNLPFLFFIQLLSQTELAASNTILFFHSSVVFFFFVYYLIATVSHRWKKWRTAKQYNNNSYLFSIRFHTLAVTHVCASIDKNRLPNNKIRVKKIKKSFIFWFFSVLLMISDFFSGHFSLIIFRLNEISIHVSPIDDNHDWR